MRVLVLGGTGRIGSAVVAALLARGHGVSGLARSPQATAGLRALGAESVSGDIRAPEGWLPALDGVEGVVHAAASFDAAAMAAEDRTLLDGLLPALSRRSRPAALLYTGGCWLFGASNGRLIDETSPFDPPESWRWMVEGVRRVLAAPGLRGMVVHPGMVYVRGGGVLARFVADAKRLGRIRIVGSEQVHWPLVHAEDLAALYALALERAAAGASYHGVAAEAVTVGRIARTMARGLGIAETPIVRSADDIAAELGEWARGHALDQQISGERARRELGWAPRHLDPLTELV